MFHSVTDAVYMMYDGGCTKMVDIRTKNSAPSGHQWQPATTGKRVCQCVLGQLQAAAEPNKCHLLKRSTDKDKADKNAKIIFYRLSDSDKKS